MIKLINENLFKIESNHSLNKEEFASLDNNLKSYLQKIKDRNLGFYDCIDDKDVINQIKNFAESVKGKFQNIVILGIGGSALGPICLKESLTHFFSQQTPKLFIIDNIDPTLIRELEESIELKETLFLVITKSGGTPETVSQYFYFRNQCEKNGINPIEHFIFVTDPEKGLLREIANTEGFQTFPVPDNVGGRFSVLTAVGLLPAALIGINIEELITGAKKARENFLSEDPNENLPFQLAVTQFLLNKKGKSINVMMPYSNKLARFADWYSQLLGESIGKKLDNTAKEVFVGITPVRALGATDQHSQSQLYNEGPNDKFFIFLEVENFGPEIAIPNLNPTHPATDYLKNTSFNELINIEKVGTEMAYTENQRPNITVKIPTVNSENLGELFLLFEGSIAFLGEMFNINAYDQPGVELSKIITKKLLLEKHDNTKV